MSAKFSELIAYFETLATKHKSILHSESEKHFFRMEIDEILAGINRTDVQYPLLALEGYSFDFADNRSDNVFKNRRGFFTLVDHVSDIHDYNTINQKWDELEAIATDILVKIRTDKRAGNIAVIRDFDFTSVDARLIMNEIGNDVGFRVSYVIASPIDTDIDQTKWNS